MQWVVPRTVNDPFLQWRLGCHYVCGRIYWKLVLYAILWKLWLERSNRVFKNKSNFVGCLVCVGMGKE